MSPDVRGDTISAELENSCALEPIHLLGTVQSYGFLMVIDVAGGAGVSTMRIESLSHLEEARRRLALDGLLNQFH